MGHQGQDGFVMVFSDETGDDRSSKEMGAFVDGLRAVAAEHGFDIQSWGTPEQMKGLQEPKTASENPNGFVEKCDVPTGPVPTDSDRAKAKAALGELGEVTTAVEAVARLLAEERAAWKPNIMGGGTFGVGCK